MRKGRIIKGALSVVAICFIDGLFHCPVLRAMPRFMEWYDASSYANAEMRGKCTTCHVSNDGSGPLNEFGQAFAKQGYRFTPALRQAYPAFFAGGSAGSPPPVAKTFDAKAFYGENCAMCHGDDGTGGGVAPNVPDFTDVTWQRGEKNAVFIKTIKDGKGLMPPWKEKLSDDQVQAMVRFVRGFAEGDTSR